MRRTVFKVPQVRSGVYLLKKGGKAVYVGSSSNVLCRLAGHRQKDFDAIEIRWMAIAKARHHEAELIRSLKPELNVVFQGSESPVKWTVPAELQNQLRTLRSEGFDLSRIVSNAVKRDMPRIEELRQRVVP